MGHLTSYAGGKEIQIDATGKLGFSLAGPWTPIPGLTNLTFKSVTGVVGYGPGFVASKTAVFAVTADNATDPAALYEITEDGTSGTWAAPVRLASHVLAFDATADTTGWDPTTKVYVFLTDQNYHLKEGVFDYQGNQLAGWQALGTQPFATVAATTTVLTQDVVNNEYQYTYAVHVFAVKRVDHSVWYHLESAAPDAWTNLGGSGNEIIAYESGQYALVAVNNGGPWLHNLISRDGSSSGWRPGNMMEAGEM
jgi:hypothetical protein